MLDQRNTARELRCAVARNSPEGEKSMDRGALLNSIQSRSDPVTTSHTRMHLSIDDVKSHLESWLKQMSVILLVAADGKCRTRFRPVFTFKRERDRSDVEMATKSFNLL